MNDKCAAGTGRFLEIMANVLEVDIGELGEMSLRAQKEIEMSTMCAVFAESEVVSLIAEGNSREDISAGLHKAIVDRVLSLAHRVGINGVITLTGGVNKNSGIIHALKHKLSVKINIPEEPQIVGALGAALFARQLNLGLLSKGLLNASGTGAPAK
jgi:predicted CoA-substrate-specific enzyme activase